MPGDLRRVPHGLQGVTLTIDPKTGVGTVLYSTPMLWQYAFARENNGFKNDWLFRVLHAPK